MPKLDDDQMQKLERLMDVDETLTSWEREFVEDMSEKFEKYGENTFVSHRQWETIDKIIEKMEA